MKKTYIQPIVEIGKTTLNTSILGISLDIDDENQGVDLGGDDTGGINPDVNRFHLWDDDDNEL